MPSRPLLLSVVQYQSQLASGALTVFDLLDKADALGLEGVELRREVWPGHKTEAAAVRARAAELRKLVTYATFSTLFAKDDAAYQLMLEDIETAQALGSPLLRLFPGATAADDDYAGWAKAEQVVNHAASHGIQIALENFSGTPGGTLAEAQHILARIKSPALKVNIDTGNYPLHGQDVIEAVRAIGDRAIYVHVKDYAGTPGGPSVALGEGVMPLAQIFEELNALPQQIIYCFEFSGGDDPDARLKNARQHLRAIRAI